MTGGDLSEWALGALLAGAATIVWGLIVAVLHDIFWKGDR